jgi:galactose mutarotase-like enzyme
MLREGTINGHQALWLENDLLEISVLPQKGADIFQFIHKPSGVDFLMKTPSGLQPPGDTLPTDFLDNYEGGWQELFPNPGEPYEHHGTQIPFHGEVALLPWDYTVEQDDEQSTSVRFTVRCQHTPFQIERVMRLQQGESSLEVAGRVTNLSDTVEYFSWGHHIVLGGDFLEADSRLDIPASRIITPDELYEPATARLAPGQDEHWPQALGRKPGERFDLSWIPGPEAHTHDDVFLTGLERGRLDVSNPRLGLSFWLEWDAKVFGCVVNWQPFGGSDMPPLTGIYGAGMEPWVTRFDLAQAIQRGEAMSLEPGASLSTSLRAGVSQSNT